MRTGPTKNGVMMNCVTRCGLTRNGPTKNVMTNDLTTNDPTTNDPTKNGPTKNVMTNDPTTTGPTTTGQILMHGGLTSGRDHSGGRDQHRVQTILLGHPQATTLSLHHNELASTNTRHL